MIKRPHCDDRGHPCHLRPLLPSLGQCGHAKLLNDAHDARTCAALALHPRRCHALLLPQPGVRHVAPRRTTGAKKNERLTAEPRTEASWFCLSDESCIACQCHDENRICDPAPAPNAQASIALTEMTFSPLIYAPFGKSPHGSG